MSRIHLLEDDVINKIAAGEVVERPASVVKELVENALDAGATEIGIDLLEGGRKLIAVSDNGSGMAPDDMVLAVRRHATSKITNVDDLFRIQSMGFRGEALASIASVSRFTLTSRQPHAANAARLQVDGGVVGALQSCSADLGTTISVEDLFSQVPARAAFLKSAPAELAHITELVRAMALAHPHVKISLKHNRKEQMLLLAQSIEVHTPWFGEAVLRARFAAASQEQDLVASMLYVQRADESFQWEALLTPPGFEKPSSRGMYFFVNNRLVRDQSLRYAVLRGYHGHLLKGRYPVSVLRLTVNPSLVDVNVHPAKVEIRLQYASDIYNHISGGVRDRLRQADFAAAPVFTAPPLELSEQGQQPAVLRTSTPLSRMPGSYREMRAAQLSNTVTASSAMTASEVIPWHELNFIGTFDKLYLLFGGNERMLVVDQHAFHERILFERLMADPDVLGGCQPLLVPESMPLTPQQREVWDAIAPAIIKLGFDLRLQGDTDLEVHGVPALLMRRDPILLLSALLDECQTSDADALAKVAHLALATIACHAAVRGGEELTEDDLRQLLAQATTVDFYHNCPHGRRVFKWWSKSEVARWFDR